MCWKSRNIPLKRVAKNDIHVQKIMNCKDDVICSPIKKECVWVKCTLYKTELEEPVYFENIDKFVINIGFHSASNIKYDKGDWVSYSTGIFNKTLFDRDSHERVFEAVIPAGSVYYVNEFNEYVSDQLILL